MINENNINGNIRLLKHSSLVAISALEIAKKLDGVNPIKAYQAGLFHDIGKLYLDKTESYKHPFLGYKMMENTDKFIAEICLTHPFPIFDLYDYIKYYCHNDSKEFNNIKNAIQNIQNNIYIKLIQLCDKICSSDGIVTIEEKFDTYKKKYNVEHDFINKNYQKLQEIKKEIEFLSGIELYDFLNKVIGLF